MTPSLEAIFGNRTAASVLLFLENYDSGHASRIAMAYGIPLYAVQKQLQKLEAAGVLVSRKVGRTRVFEFNPRNPRYCPKTSRPNISASVSDHAEAGSRLSVLANE